MWRLTWQSNTANMSLVGNGWRRFIWVIIMFMLVLAQWFVMAIAHKVFCVGLWCLDEYWYYSLFTLFVLFMFKSTMTKSRLKTLTELRRGRVDSQILMVHRCGKWVKLSNIDLLSRDVVSIGRSSGQNGEEKSVPANMLLLARSVIVNEAILTGESTPQWKISIMGRGMKEKLSAKRDKSHVLFGGTKILQHTPNKSFPLKAPGGGWLAIVLRTSWESGFFILFLVVFALIAAGYVLVKLMFPYKRMVNIDMMVLLRLNDPKLNGCEMNSLFIIEQELMDAVDLNSRQKRKLETESLLQSRGVIVVFKEDYEGERLSHHTSADPDIDNDEPIKNKVGYDF
ncbi:manganese-transporting ATPase PDR2 [Spatholobus suberectus]|nr:manganese-transporting ATPase PDR2 [Spatholobus suberectus]